MFYTNYCIAAFHTSALSRDHFSARLHAPTDSECTVHTSFLALICHKVM